MLAKGVHINAGTFAPNLARLRHLSQSVIEGGKSDIGTKHTITHNRDNRAHMQKMDVARPQSPRTSMQPQRRDVHQQCLREASLEHLQVRPHAYRYQVVHALQQKLPLLGVQGGATQQHCVRQAVAAAQKLDLAHLQEHAVASLRWRDMVATLEELGLTTSHHTHVKGDVAQTHCRRVACEQEKELPQQRGGADRENRAHRGGD